MAKQLGKTRTIHDINLFLQHKHDDIVLKSYIDHLCNNNFKDVSDNYLTYFGSNIEVLHNFAKSVDQLLQDTIETYFIEAGYVNNLDYVKLNNNKIKTSSIIKHNILLKYNYDKELYDMLNNVLLC